MSLSVHELESNNPELYSLVVIKLKGINDITTNHGSKTTYTVMQGEVTFTVGNERHMLREGDSLTVPKDVRYQNLSIGGVIMEAACDPPFDPSLVEYHETTI